jgi:formate hydrogenlyase subunit 3/multisubunit Na+/H+ antiporter MnhD subunit
MGQIFGQILQAFRDPLVGTILIPLLAGAVAYLVARWTPFVCKVLAVAAAVVVGARGVALAQASGAVGFHWAWASLPGGVTLSVDLARTTLGLAVLLGSAGFTLLVCLYSLRAMAGHRWEGKFYTYVTWALAGAAVVALADNLLVLLVGWELVTLMLFLLINLGTGQARVGAAKAYGVLGFADACLLLAVALLVARPGGTGNLLLSRGAVVVSSLGATGYVIYALILIAALAKAGAIPLHSWIPAIAEDAPTPVLALLPAAVDKLLGIYLLAIASLRMFRPDWTMQVILMCVGAVTILAAVTIAMVQQNLKKLLSFQAVAQVGYMVLGLGTGTIIGVLGGLFQMINCAVYNCGLFLMSGSVRRATGSDELEDMGGLARVLPVTFAGGIVAAAAISGVPPFSGFVGKWMIYQGTLEVGSRGLATALLLAAVFGSALTLASLVKVMYGAFLSPAPRSAAATLAGQRESFWMAAPVVVLAVVCIVLGLWPQLLVNPVLAPAVAGTAVTGPGLSDVGANLAAGTLGLWNPTQATGLIFIGLILGVILRWVASAGRKVRVVRPFLCGEVPGPRDDRFRVPSTQFYETLDRIPLLRTLLKHGQAGAMDLYRWMGRYGHALVETLRAQHTGLLSLYVAWCVVGLSVTLVYLLITVR